MLLVIIAVVEQTEVNSSALLELTAATVCRSVYICCVVCVQARMVVVRIADRLYFCSCILAPFYIDRTSIPTKVLYYC